MQMLKLTWTFNMFTVYLQRKNILVFVKELTDPRVQSKLSELACLKKHCSVVSNPQL